MDTKVRNKERTYTNIRRAIVRLEQGKPKITKVGRKLSVAAVAEEAGVSRALIHNQYPDLLERIRTSNGKNMKNQRDKKHDELVKERNKCKKLRKQVTQLLEQRAILVSKNASLELEIQRLITIMESDNTIVLSTMNGKSNV